MSGRKGIGVKADDLLDRLEAKARDGIAERNRELDSAELERLARQIATAALRFLMVKATTTRVIAFDFDEALNFEGETGPYLQYSLVREANIRRKLEAAGLASDRRAATEVEALPAELWSDDLWDLVLSVAQIEETVRRAAETLELSLLARHAVDLARKFHAHLSPPSDPARGRRRAAAGAARRQRHLPARARVVDGDPRDPFPTDVTGGRPASRAMHIGRRVGLGLRRGGATRGSYRAKMIRLKRVVRTTRFQSICFLSTVGMS